MHKFMIGDKVFNVHDIVDPECNNLSHRVGKVIGIILDISKPEKDIIYEVLYDSDEEGSAIKKFKQRDLVKYIERSEYDNYINIEFQKGSVDKFGINGCQAEDVIDVLINKLEKFQNSEDNCHENNRAITKLREAKMWLNERTLRRIEERKKWSD